MTIADTDTDTLYRPQTLCNTEVARTFGQRTTNRNCSLKFSYAYSLRCFKSRGKAAKTQRECQKVATLKESKVYKNEVHILGKAKIKTI